MQWEQGWQSKGSHTLYCTVDGGGREGERESGFTRPVRVQKEGSKALFGSLLNKKEKVSVSTAADVAVVRDFRRR